VLRSRRLLEKAALIGLPRKGVLLLTFGFSWILRCFYGGIGGYEMGGRWAGTEFERQILGGDQLYHLVGMR
jgi:hypothetical protein